MSTLSHSHSDASETVVLESARLAVAPVRIDDGLTHPPVADVAILTGGGDKPYALGLAAALSAQGTAFDFIGSDEVDAPALHNTPFIRFLNLRGNVCPDTSAARKAFRMLLYYLRLVRYAVDARPRIFHILWNNKFVLIDRTLLTLYYRICGKRIVLTAHNVNARERDGADYWLNRLTLRCQYRLADHIFVHTRQMQQALENGYGVPAEKISVIPFGLNDTVPQTALTRAEAKKRLGLEPEHKAMLFFGHIAPYKGLEYLIAATVQLLRDDPYYRLIVVGRPKNCPDYWKELQQQLARPAVKSCVISRIEFVPDADTELYFKAADVLMLPYTYIFQSGVMILSYNFGLPVIASDVGSFREDVIIGRTGFIHQPRDVADLARTVREYFDSALYLSGVEGRERIRAFAQEKYSWETVAARTCEEYARILRAATR